MSLLLEPLWYGAGPMAKSPCPVTLKQFQEKAEPLKVVINGQEMLAEVKAFSTGSFGWNINGKMTITVDGKSRLLENQWTVEPGVVLLRFAAENTGDQRRINAHGVEVQSADRMQLLYRVAVGEVVRATLVRKPPPALP